MSMVNLTVIKLDYLGRETWRYNGLLLERGENHIILKAYYDHQDDSFEGLLLRKGDLFIETFYNDRWYNIFEVYDAIDENLKGWYCNIGWPAKIQDNTISYRDLAIDLLVFPDGRQTILDLDEFEALSISQYERQQAKTALKNLQKLFNDKAFPQK